MNSLKYRERRAKSDRAYMKRCFRKLRRGRKAAVRFVDLLFDAAELLPICEEEAEGEDFSAFSEIYGMVREVSDILIGHDVKCTLPEMLRGEREKMQFRNEKRSSL